MTTPEKARKIAEQLYRHNPEAATALRELAGQVEALETNEQGLRLRLLSAAGDDLCRLSQEEIKAYTSGKVQIPPKEEFIPSCERFHAQMASEAGVLEGCLTLAQLIAENAKLTIDLGIFGDRLFDAEKENERLREENAKIRDGAEPTIELVKQAARDTMGILKENQQLRDSALTAEETALLCEMAKDRLDLIRASRATVGTVESFYTQEDEDAAEKLLARLTKDNAQGQNP